MLCLAMGLLVLRASAFEGFEQLTRPRKVGGSIDTERNGVNERDVDAHAGFERAQLLEPLALLERRRRQRDETLERRPADRRKGRYGDRAAPRPMARCARVK